jgi:hypothetical protein
MGPDKGWRNKIPVLNDVMWCESVFLDFKEWYGTGTQLINW